MIREGFARGELSYSKVRALTRVADESSESDLIELARHATAAQLERMVRAARRVSAAAADEQQRSSYVRWYWDEADGCMHLDAKLGPTEGALFLRALESARDALYDRRLGEAEEREQDRGGSAGPPAAIEPGGSAEPPPPELSPWDSHAQRPVGSPTNAESLAALSESALARPPTGTWDRSAAERYQVVVHVDADTLATDSPGASVEGPGACAIADGPGISPETARRLACDAGLVALVEKDGKPLSVGRRTRSIPPAIRRALLARDGRCQFPGCERRRFVDAHHIDHWARGGETSLDNLVLLCRHHHRLVHEGGYSIDVTAEGRQRFRDPAGTEVPAVSPAAVTPAATATGSRQDAHGHRREHGPGLLRGRGARGRALAPLTSTARGAPSAGGRG